MSIQIDKQQLHTTIIAALQALVDNAQIAVDRAYETATHEENVAENKYDTLGLEASYLTQGQARRLEECQSDLKAYEAMALPELTEHDAICIGALIQVVDDADHEQTFFLGPAAGGLKVQFNDKDVVIITPSSPLGNALLRAMIGDEVIVQIASKETLYEVMDIN